MNNIVRWDQSRGLTPIQDQANRLFEGNFTADRSRHAGRVIHITYNGGWHSGPRLTLKRRSAMFGRREPPLTDLVRRIFNAATNTRRIIENWPRDEKELNDEPAVGRHVLGKQ